MHLSCCKKYQEKAAGKVLHNARAVIVDLFPNMIVGHWSHMTLRVQACSLLQMGKVIAALDEGDKVSLSIFTNVFA